MKDCVIPYRFSYSDEIIYSIRSLQNIPHRDVYVIGDKPSLSVKHIPYIQSINIAANTLNIINIAVSTDSISEEFIYLHDDMFILKPLKKIPVHHRGKYKDILKKYRIKGVRSFYVRRMQKTYLKLIEMGIKEPLCYEIHVPFVINKTKWKEVSKYITPELNKISMYANLNQLGGTYLEDVKVRTKDWMPDGNFVSTHDSTFKVNRAGNRIRELFSERSVYEVQ